MFLTGYLPPDYRNKSPTFLGRSFYFSDAFADSIRIVAKDKSALSELEAHKKNLVNLQVYKVQLIKVRRYVVDAGSRQYGADDTGDVLLGESASTDNGLSI